MMVNSIAIIHRQCYFESAKYENNPWRGDVDEEKLVKSGTKASVMAMALLLGAGTVTGTGLSVMLHGTAEAKEMTKEQTNIMNNMSSIQVIGETTNWKYLDDNTDPAQGKDSLTAWTARDFDDKSLERSNRKIRRQKRSTHIF